MPSYNFFSKFGLYTKSNFFDSKETKKIRSQIDKSNFKKARVLEDGDSYAIDEKSRQTKLAQVTSKTKLFVADKILNIKDDIEKHFNISLRNIQDPQFLVYDKNDFFTLHVDNSNNPNDDKNVRNRKISVIIFLNSGSEIGNSDSFSGGSLTFYDLLKNPEAKSLGIPLSAEVGLLVAFKSDILHEVTPITSGKRYTIVTWFY